MTHIYIENDRTQKINLSDLLIANIDRSQVFKAAKIKAMGTPTTETHRLKNVSPLFYQ